MFAKEGKWIRKISALNVRIAGRSKIQHYADNKDKLNESIPFTAISAEIAALKILNGVKKNQGVIIFPFYAKLLWWVNRVSSRLAAPLARKMIADFRKLRDKEMR